MNKPVKCVIVGDGEVGKTSLIISYSTGVFATDYIPTIFDEVKVTVMFNEIEVDLTLWDTAGQEEYERLRPFVYPQTDVFVICFSLVNRVSFSNVKSHWYKELAHFKNDTPIILVGTKQDKRDQTNENTVSKNEGLSLAKVIKASTYIECSSLTQIGVKRVFDEAVKAALGYKPTPKRRCSFL